MTTLKWKDRLWLSLGSLSLNRLPGSAAFHSFIIEDFSNNPLQYQLIPKQTFEAENINKRRRELNIISKLHVRIQRLCLYKYSKRVFSVVRLSVNNNRDDKTSDIFPYGRTIRLCSCARASQYGRRILLTIVFLFEAKDCLLFGIPLIYLFN